MFWCPETAAGPDWLRRDEVKQEFGHVMSRDGPSGLALSLGLLASVEEQQNHVLFECDVFIKNEKNIWITLLKVFPGLSSVYDNLCGSRVPPQNISGRRYPSADPGAWHRAGVQGAIMVNGY